MRLNKGETVNKLISMLVMAFLLMSMSVFASVNSPPEQAIKQESVRQSETVNAQAQSANVAQAENIYKTEKANFAVVGTIAVSASQETKTEAKSYKPGAKEFPYQNLNTENRIITKRGYGSPPIVMRN